MNLYYITVCIGVNNKLVVLVLIKRYYRIWHGIITMNPLCLLCLETVGADTSWPVLGNTIGVRDGGQGGQLPPPPNSGSLSTYIRAERRHYSGKTQYMFE